MDLQKNTWIKVIFSILGIFFIALQANNIRAQFTLIPDPIFEQALIDLGIDSDGMINGQVLTSDIEIVITLDLDHEGIEDLTGLEDFAALEVLIANGNQLSFLDVSNNIQLKELYCSSDSAGFNMLMSSLDLSQNENLEVLYGENLIFLENVNVKNENNAILTVTLPCEFEGEPCELDLLDCVTVDDEEAANNNQSPYSNWSIVADFIYSEDCALGILPQNNAIFSVYPSPVKDIVILSSNNASPENLKIKIYTTEGKLIHNQDLHIQNEASIDVSTLSGGIYFMSVQNEKESREVIKFVKL